MSTNDQPATEPKRSLKQSMLLLVRVAMVFNTAVAAIWTAFNVLVLDALTNVADYTGFGKAAMIIITLVASFLGTFGFLVIAELILGAGFVVCTIAWHAISGRSAGKPHAGSSNNTDTPNKR